MRARTHRAAWLALCCGAALAGIACGGASQAGRTPAAAAVPDWYAPEAAPDPARYIVGRGSCGAEVAPAHRRRCAATRALENAVLAVQARVEAVQEQSCQAQWSRRTEDGERGAQQTRTACDSKLASRAEGSLELSNASPTEQACDREGNCYARIVLAREQLARRLERQADPLRAALDDLLARASNAGPIEASKLLAQALERAPALDEQALLLAAVRHQAPTPQSYTRRVLERRRALLAGLDVCLREEGSEGSPHFTATLRALSEAGLERVRLAPRCEEATLQIALQLEDPEPPAPSNDLEEAWVVERKGTLSILRSGGREPDAPAGPIRKAVSGRGLARDAEHATRDAEAQLQKAIRRAVTRTLLGTAT